MSPSPCTWCISDAPCPCPPFLAWDEAVNGVPEEPRCLTCVDCEHLTLSGEAWEQVAARLGLKPLSLERHLHRHGRGDLIPTGARRRAS